MSVLKNTIKEITPLTEVDCFTLFSRHKESFNFPLHYHEEFELNFIENASGAQRIVGNHISEIEEWELVLIGPNLPHSWQTHKCTTGNIHEITIQFHKNLFEESFLKKNQLSNIRNMFEKASRGIAFPKELIKDIAPQIKALANLRGFTSVLELMSVLYKLSLSGTTQILSSAPGNTGENLFYNSRRIEKTIQYLNANYSRQITLEETASIANMATTAFSRFFKVKTGTNFIDCLLEIRLGHASKMLIDTTNSIAEIAYNCGFNNISNFNRIFKKKKGCTPKEFREGYHKTGTRIFI